MLFLRIGSFYDKFCRSMPMHCIMHLILNFFIEPKIRNYHPIHD